MIQPRLVRSLLTIIPLLLIGFNALGIQETIIEERNEFDGQTTTYEDKKQGILRGTIYYGSDNSKMKEEILYDPLRQSLFGVEKITRFFHFNKKIKEERVFTLDYSAESLILKEVHAFDRDNGNILSIQHIFTQSHMGHNTAYYNNGTVSRIEWFYPETVEGVQKAVHYYTEDGLHTTMVEYFYTEKTTETEGYFKLVQLFKDDQRSLQTWYFTTDYARTHGGVLKKVERFTYKEDSPTKITVDYFGADDRWIVNP